MKTADAYGRIDAAEEKGEKKGEKRGRKQEKLAVAKALLKKGMSVDEVSEITGLPTQDVQSLVKEKV